MNVMINFMGRDGAGAVCSLEWAKGFKKIGCGVYAVISRDISNLNEWKKLLADDQLYLAETYKDQDKLSFVITTLKFMTLGKYKIKKKFKDVEFDFTLRTLYHHWAYIADKAVQPQKIVTLCHDPINHSDEKKYITILYRKYVKQSDEVFVLTKSFIPDVHDIYGISTEHIHYVPHGRMNMYKKSLENCGHEYDKNKYNFLFFGFIRRYKGLHVLAKAYKIVSEKRKNVSLTIVGNGSFTEYKVEYGALTNVKIVNRFINDTEVAEYFDGPNVISVIPYIDATQSGVIPIAFEYETPIIASDTGGLKEQLDNGKIGLLFEAGNAEALADCMLHIMDNKKLFAEQIMLMKDYRVQLEWDRIARKMIDSMGMNL